MPMADLSDVSLNWHEDGSVDGPPVVLAGSLGTDLRLWDDLVARLPRTLRIIRYDMRGHGQSSVPDAPYAMGTLVRDAEQLLDHLNVRDCVFVGLSIGGMVAQGLAVKRLDLVRGIVLSNTAVKMGTTQMWHDRIDTVRAGGIEAIADAVMERWFAPKFRASDALPFWRDMLTGTPIEGYCGCCAAIAGTDFITPTSGLRLPCLGIAGDRDGASPPDLVRETIDLIPGARFYLIRGAGHLPCVEAPEAYAAVIEGFLKEIGHV
ncbi:3-oxoadipate enol-lactonase [Aliiroseovarius sp. YM-037]|uniref:3-oxoadipate enol-lactonase n=1 Tax=Aliiroseovarius sp. YM-037 TaxID=3341728 RepID=UPI003A7FCB41